MFDKLLGFVGLERKRPRVGALSSDAEAAASLMMQMQAQQARIRASYDAARTTDEFKNYWANADHYDADSANSYQVRKTLVSRSRYEVNNNGYADGIAQTYANDCVGIGPTLRMQSGSEGFNRMVEFSWSLWAESVQLPRKLWCLAHAKHVDGEAFAELVRNPSVEHPIQLDLLIRETDQCHSPSPSFLADAQRVDGIQLDRFGNPVAYEFLQSHPGAARSIGFETNLVPAEFVAHWFKMRRGGQHRAVPELASTLNTGAAGRRWREANIAAAERAALLTLMMKTQMTPDEADAVAPFSTMDIEKGMMSFLPAGWDPFQAEGKFPTASHESFHKSIVNEMARPKSMPYNKAACDSSSYNYASGRLDHQTYYSSLDVDRYDCNCLVLNKVFKVWFNMAIYRFGWLLGDPDKVGAAARLHIWDWPKHRVADVESEANANETRLKTGQVSLPSLFSEAGLDFEDELIAAATAYGLSVDELRKRIVDVLFPLQQQGGAPAQQQQQQQQQTSDEAVTAVLQRISKNGNGVLSHG